MIQVCLCVLSALLLTAPFVSAADGQVELLTTLGVGRKMTARKTMFQVAAPSYRTAASSAAASSNRHRHSATARSEPEEYASPLDSRILKESNMVKLRRHPNATATGQLPNDYIINGSPAPRGAYPYYAVSAILTGAPIICGASLVASDFLVTAAHCKDAFLDSIFEFGYQAIVGAVSHTEGIELVDIVGYAIHPDYNDDNLDNDLMLLQIDPPITSFSPIPINTNRGSPVDNELLLIMGLGRISDDGTLPEDLLEADVRAVSRSDCRGYYSRGEGVLCAWNKSPLRMVCQGDSGGPLVDQRSSGDLLLGVTSFVPPAGCESGVAPSGFTRLSFYVSWLRAVICENSASPPSYLCRSNPPPSPSPPSCSSAGGSCASQRDCCFGNPMLKCFGSGSSNKKCAVCGRNMHNCATNTECCDYPIRGRCSGGKCGTCVGKNRKCMNSFQCCHSMARCARKNQMGMFVFVCNM